MIFQLNPLPSRGLRNIKTYCLQKMKVKMIKLSSAAILLGALRVKLAMIFHSFTYFFFIITIYIFILSLFIYFFWGGGVVRVCVWWREEGEGRWGGRG